MTISVSERSKFCYHTTVPPKEAYITAMEEASSKLPPMEADQLRSDVSCLIRQPNNNYKNNTNLNLTECRALTGLKQDSSRVVLTADKGVAMVVIDLQDYTNKAQALLQDTNTYKILSRDPTIRLKNKLTQTLKDIKQTGALSNLKYKQPYPTSAVCPKFYDFPKIHKVGIPLRPVVSSRGSITYGVAKELAYINKAQVDQSPYHLKNTHFIQQSQNKRLEPGELITSFDVKALFTSVLVGPSI